MDDPIRADIAELRHHVDVIVEKALREQTKFFFIWWAVLLAAIIGLYGTVITLAR